jgi:hypothetical protein
MTWCRIQGRCEMAGAFVMSMRSLRGGMVLEADGFDPRMTLLPVRGSWLLSAFAARVV